MSLTSRGEYVQFSASSLHLSLNVDFMRGPQLTRCGVQIVADRDLTRAYNEHTKSNNIHKHK